MSDLLATICRAKFAHYTRNGQWPTKLYATREAIHKIVLDTDILPSSKGTPNCVTGWEALFERTPVMTIFGCDVIRVIGPGFRMHFSRMET